MTCRTPGEPPPPAEISLWNSHPASLGGGTFGASPSEGLLRFREGRKRLKNRGRSRKPGRRLRSLRIRF